MTRTTCALAGALAAAGSARADVVSWLTVGTGFGPSLSAGGITVTGSADVNWEPGPFLGGAGGLGIRGGPPGDDRTLDLGESITFDFGTLVTGVSMEIWDIDPPGNVNFSFQAFNGAISLGTFAVPVLSANPEWKDRTALAGGQSFTRVTFAIDSTPALFGMTFQKTEFTVVPAPGAAVLAGVGLLMLGRRRRA